MELPHLNNNVLLKSKSLVNIEEEQISIPLRKFNSLEDFLGDDSDSTEISSIIAGIDSYHSTCSELDRNSLNHRSESEEILTILKVPHTTKNKNTINNLSSITPFGQPRRISLTGKVLTVKFEKTTPERTSNPVFKNFNTFEETLS
jgi:hypothetical protein